MTDKISFVRRWKYMRLFVAVFTVIMLGTAAIYPRGILLEWVVFLPIWSVMLWRWRCWNCGDASSRVVERTLKWARMASWSNTKLAAQTCR